MGQYADRVDRQRRMLEAEEWAEGIRSVHTHSISSMWYDNRPEDTKLHSVVDTQFNDNSILRRLKDGTQIWMVERPSIEVQMDLYSTYEASLR